MSKIYRFRDKLVLASQSPARRVVLENIGLKPIIDPSGVVESLELDDLENSLKTLAINKATSVSHKYPGKFIIGVDTVILHVGMVIGKANDRDDAKRILNLLSGNWHEVITAIAVIHGNKCDCRIVKTKVKFKELEEDEINEYLATSDEFRGKAAAYGIQGKAGVFVEAINGCYFNIVGLPLSTLSKQLIALKE